MVALDKLEPLQPESFKTLTKKNYQRLKAAILDVGFSFPELVWQSRNKFYIVDGHQRVRALQQMLKEGYTLPGGKLPVSFTEAKNKKEALRKIAMGTSQYGEYDEESMYEFMHLAGLDLADLKEWGALPQLHMGKLEVGYFRDIDPADDDVPEPPKVAVTKLGDLWELGGHRLLCGDTTEPKNVSLVMKNQKADLCFTSPPYALGLSAKLSGNTSPLASAGKPYLHDDDSSVDWASLMELWFSAVDTRVSLHAINLQPLAGNKRVLIQWIAKRVNRLVDIIVWNKSAAAPQMAKGVLTSAYEWIVLIGANGASRSIPFSSWRGTVSSVYDGPPQRENKNAAIHLATMPVHLPVFVIGQLCDLVKTVIDPFCGTGTTMIAAEKLNRRCYGIEIEPRYVDVCVERWQQVSGKKAKRVKAK